jgi:hypothetical protein
VRLVLELPPQELVQLLCGVGSKEGQRERERKREREMQRGKTGAEYTVCRRQKHGTHSDTERLRKLRDTREVDIRRRERERERE